MTGIPALFPFFVCECLRLVTWVIMLPWDPAGFLPPDLCCGTFEPEVPAGTVDVSMGIHVLAQLQQAGLCLLIFFYGGFSCVRIFVVHFTTSLRR